jgi:phosphoglycerate dehydrogenase-like enzyme
VILLPESVHHDAQSILEEADAVQLVEDLAAFDPRSYGRNVRAVVTRGRGQVDRQLIAALPDLVVVARCGAGLDNVDTGAAAAAGVAVVHAPGLTTSAVAEHALMLMLALARRVVEIDGAVKAGRWNVRDGFESIELRGKRMGVIGLGAIGTKLAEFGRMLDMDVVCATRRPPDADVERVGLDELLTTSDVVQLCVPLSDSTRSMIGPAQFASMKPGALLVNTSRGAVVDHVALADALARNSLAGYATDVWEPEPPGADDPVLSDRRVLVTPHVAGLTDVTYREICVRPAEAVTAILTGVAPDPRWVYAADRNEPE